MRALSAVITISCLTILTDCKLADGKVNALNGIGKTAVFAREPDDSADYRLIKFDFYRYKDGQLCERRISLARPFDSACNCEFMVYYNKYLNPGDSGVGKPLDSIIDIASFTQVEKTNFSKDKNHVYYFSGNSDGGNREIVNKADPATFKRLCEYRWGIDKNLVFYQSEPLEGLNLKRLQVLYPPDTSDHFIEYVKDDKYVYYNGTIINGADAKTFIVVSGKKWQAQDRHHKYE